ncbi:MAG: hypothetical protein A2148_02955 [Chloroflexi bacterium RBG_16_68_14]|nr:MAG: hypothetical protein A2148_02955 [Chloroflexi bacterium RBG_16_68_14]
MSEDAKSLLSELLEGRAESAQVFRLAKKGDEFELSFEIPTEGDVLFQHGEADVLAVAPDVAETLEGLSIDLVETEESPRLVLV